MPDNQNQTPPPFQPSSPVPPPPPSAPATPAPGSPESQARTWNMLCHLSALAGFIIPFGSILGPLLVWQIKKTEIPSVTAHGKAALNFQITVAIALVVSIVLGLLLSSICIGAVFFILAPAIGLAGLIFAIIAGLKANDGKDYQYPYSFNLVK
jgi:uncharacterized protein